MTTITVTRAKQYKPPNRSARFDWRWLYQAQGPDTIESGGRTLPRRFDNRSLVELRRVLRRAYGPDVEIVEAWEEAA